MNRRRGSDSGAAIVDFVLITVVLVPLVLAIMQVALVLHVRNTLTTAASDGARHAVVDGAYPSDGVERARAMITQSLGSQYARNIAAQQTRFDGSSGVRVDIEASVPALGILGTVAHVHVRGRAVGQTSP